MTREHRDLDFGIWLADMPRIEEVLAADGWLNLRDPDVDGGKAFGRDGVRLELTYLYATRTGRSTRRCRTGRAAAGQIGRWPTRPANSTASGAESSRSRR
jgi:hypothetical protein